MKKFSYRVFAWALAGFIFSLMIYRPPGRSGLPIHDRTLPAGDPEMVAPVLQHGLAKLMAEFPCGFDVELRAFDDADSDVWGWTTWDDEREIYEIHYYSLAPLVVMGETIMHEYTHVLVYDMPQQSDHDALFWVMYGSLYRFGADE